MGPIDANAMLRQILFLALLGYACGALAHNHAILVLGDSLSAGYGIDGRQGWVSLLQERLQKQGFHHEVVNASISGDTTQGGITRLPNALKRFHPSIVVIELGGNDGLRGLSLADMKQNLAAMIEVARDQNGDVLLIGVDLPPNLGPVYTKRFRAVFTDLADTYRVPLVPSLLDGIHDKGELMQADGIHPRASAQRRILDNVWPHLQPLLGDPADVTRAGMPREVESGV